MTYNFLFKKVRSLFLIVLIIQLTTDKGFSSNKSNSPGIVWIAGNSEPSEGYCYPDNIDKQLEVKPITIVAFGNSITATRKTVDKVYAQRLPDLLLKKGIKAQIINSGIPGTHTGRQEDRNLLHKIKHGLDRFESDVLAYNSDFVIIGFGTNDAHIDSNTPEGKSRIPIEKYKSNLEYMITKLLERNVKVILMAPNILGAKHDKFQNDRLLKYVKVVRQLSKEYKTGLVDNYKSFIRFQRRTGKSYDTLMLDGMHPNDLGHELISNQLVKEILRMLK